jgi:site-specific DNA-methyltransferase (adenine-specific)
MKFEIEPLVAEMLDQLPVSVWTSKTSTFFDPAIGGGQFVRAIEQRLRNAGHSDANIRSRVMGFEESDLHIRFAVNKYKLAGQYDRKPYEKFFELDNTMKFDVIIGNPPYQGDQAHAFKIWPTITVKALSLLKTNGYIGWVIPSGWLESNNAQMKKVRTTLTSDFNLLSINRNVNQFFNVGTDILTLSARNEPYQGNTLYTEGITSSIIDLRSGLPKDASDTMIDVIISKVVDSTHNRIDFQDEHLSSSEVSEIQSKEYKHPIIYSTANRGFTKTKLNNDGILKIAVNVSSSYYSEKNTDNNMPITSTAVGALMCYIPISSVDEGEKIKTYLSSKLFRFVTLFYKRKNSGFNHAVRQRKLPQLKIKKWSDKEIYKHFGLTQEEIDYVEANVK